MSLLRAKQIKLAQNGLLIGSANGNATELSMGSAHNVLKVNAAGTGVVYETLSAANVAVTPAGNLSSSTVSAALAELQGDIDTINTTAGTLQTEVDAIETSIGLNTDGTKADFTSVNYVTGSSTVISAINTLDTALKTEETARGDADTALGVRVDNVNTALGTSGDVYGTVTGSNYLNSTTSFRGADLALDTALKAVSDSVSADTFTKTSFRAISSTTKNAAINEIADEANYSFSGTTAPTVTMDSTNGYKIGDVYVKTDTDWVYTLVDASEGAAVWKRVDQGADLNLFTWKGTVDASLEANLPVAAGAGEVYKVTVAGTFESAVGGPGQVNVGDLIVYNGTAWDKIDNTDPSVAGTTNRITVVPTGDTSYTVDISSSYVGQTSITTLGTVTTGTWNGSIVGQAYGGLGADVSGFAASSLILAGAGTATELAKGGNSTVLKVDGSGVLGYAKVDLTADVSGVLPTANGGTGASTYAEGDILLGTSGGSLSKLAVGSANKVLVSNGTTLVYGYVSNIRDSAGVSVAGVVTQTDTNNKLEAVSATVDSDNGLVYTTKGWVSGKLSAAAKTTVQEEFVPSGATTGTYAVVLAQVPLTGSIAVFVNGLKVKAATFAFATDTLTLNTTSTANNIGYELDGGDVVTVHYQYNG